MNIVALLLAVLGLIGIFIGFNLNRLVKNKYLGGLLQLIGVLGAIVLMSLVPVDGKTAAQAGQYLVYLAVIALIIKMLFFRKKKKTE